MAAAVVVVVEAVMMVRVVEVLVVVTLRTLKVVVVGVVVTVVVVVASEKAHDTCWSPPEGRTSSPTKTLQSTSGPRLSSLTTDLRYVFPVTIFLELFLTHRFSLIFFLIERS